MALSLLGADVGAAACPVDAPHGDPTVEAARQRLAAAPDRPGRWLDLSAALLRSAEPTAARACADALIERWPGAMRARVLAARAALAEGDEAAAEAHLSAVESRGPRVARAEAAAVRSAARRWAVTGLMGVHYDDHAARVDGAPSAPAPDDPAATRLSLGAGVERRGPRWRLGARLARTTHFAGRDVGDLDRTVLGLAAHRRQPLGGGPLELYGNLAGALGGRIGTPRWLGIGAGARWRASAAIAPFAELAGGARLLAERARLGDAAWLAWATLRTGVHARAGAFSIDAGAVGRVRGPDGALVDAGGEVEPAVRVGPLRAGVVAHVGRRWSTADVNTAAVGGRIGWHAPSWAAQVEGLWQRAGAVEGGGSTLDRLVVGGRLGVGW